MIKHRHFYTVPDFRPRVSRHDPRQRNHPDNFATRVNVGGDARRRDRLAAFALHT